MTTATPFVRPPFAPAPVQTKISREETLRGVANRVQVDAAWANFQAAKAEADSAEALWADATAVLAAATIAVDSADNDKAARRAAKTHKVADANRELLWPVLSRLNSKAYHAEAQFQEVAREARELARAAAKKSELRTMSKTVIQKLTHNQRLSKTTTTTTKGTKMTTDKTCKGSPVTARHLHELLTKIATENFATVETLKTRDEGSDGSDTHQCHVLSLKAALRSAFEAGQKNA